MKRYFLPLFSFSFFLGAEAQAVCPVCTVAVGAGVGFSRYLGIDDTIAGLWIGALIASVSMWTVNWLEKKNIRFPYRGIAVAAGYYLISVVPLLTLEIGGETIMGHPLNKIWGVDKLLLGIIVGSAAFYFAERHYEILKVRNGGRAHFPFQKVAWPVGALLILSAVFYFLTR